MSKNAELMSTAPSYTHTQVRRNYILGLCTFILCSVYSTDGSKFTGWLNPSKFYCPGGRFQLQTS